LLKQGSTSPRKYFKHEFYEFEQLTAITMHDKRFYELPNGELAMSVTTVLGQALDKSGIENWRREIGEEKATQVLTQAGNRGTAIHLLAERYLLNEDDWKREAMPVNLFNFKQIQPVIDEKITKIYAIEAPLYSFTLKAAGRTDCIAEWDGLPTIVDFKTSRKPKKEEWIEGYFLQATTYAMMMEERTGLKVPQFAIVIAVDDQPEPQVYVRPNEGYRAKVTEIFTGYRKM
jgi:genome maintenance exonuclease 1